MVSSTMALRFYVFFIVIAITFFTCSSAKKTYLVHMKHYMKPRNYATISDWYVDHFISVTSSDQSSILYTYDSAFHGYAAIVSPNEAEALHRSDFVVKLYEDRMYQLHTTRSPMFLGLENEFGFWGGKIAPEIHLKSQNVIIGVVDTGIWPESKSFSDTGMLSVPLWWKGKCVKANDFDPKKHCNQKLIGARVFYKAYESETGTTVQHSPRDYEGHGTHTSSTTAGSSVPGASLFGLANGTARGMANHARIAVYKACFDQGCSSADIIAAMDTAISDGINIFSISLGGSPIPYHEDPIAIAGFQANQKGIMVVCSAGNDGPYDQTVTNTAPWITTVAASTIDRTFPAFVKLGNRVTYRGISLYTGKGMGDQLVGLVYNKGSDSSHCLEGSLDPAVVRGKVVVCDRGIIGRVEKGVIVQKAGGVGVIVANSNGDGDDVEAYPFFLIPGLDVGEKEGDAIKLYATTAANPTAVLSFGGMVVNVKPAPVVAGFSSRGPNLLNPEMLKPDMTAPGVNILAAWTGASGPSGLPSDHRITAYNIISGTSMSCPHVSGVSALLKAIHPEWSPSAIRSALMTTAYTVDNNNSAIGDAGSNSRAATPYAFGAGHIQPEKAVNPGLVYEATSNDYIAFVCSLGYSKDEIYVIAGRKHACSDSQKLHDLGQFNYPSFSIVFNDQSKEVSYTRTLTNVEFGICTYGVEVSVPAFISVSVKPDKLTFNHIGEKHQYTATFKLKTTNIPSSSFGSITWKNSIHTVRSPAAFSKM